MKFEQVLQIYWSKGFLFNGRIVSFDTTLPNFFSTVGGIGKATKLKIVQRFELYQLYYNSQLSFLTLSRKLYKPINILLSQLSTVNNQIKELVRFYHVRLYLIKSFRGRAQALGKPSRGQRTWSNAWTAYYHSRVTRQFISLMQKTLQLNKVEEKIDYKTLKKKNQRKSTKTTVKKITQKNTWF